MFKKTVFGQLFQFTSCVLLLCLIFVGTLLFSVTGDYLTKHYEASLLEAAGKISKLTALTMQEDHKVNYEIYKLNLDLLSSSTNSFIFLVDSNGEVVLNSGEKATFSVKQEFYQEIFLSGKSVKYIGNLGGVFNATMLSIGCPIKADDGVVGAIFLSVAIPEVTQMRIDILHMFLVIAFSVLVIALVFNYLISRRITKPLSQLGAAAKRISAGNFKERVNLTNTTSEIGELGDIFNSMAESIEQLENMRQSFVSNVSHELRTPMTTIIGFVEGIKDGTIPPESHGKYLSIVLDESKRLSRLVNDLLDISRMEDGRLKLEMREFDINEMIRLTIIKTEKRIAAKDIRLTVNFESESSIVVADKDSIARVLTNIIDNAIKFTPQAGFIDIKTGKTGNKVYVSVTNSGMGIAQEDLMHVFDRFYKTDKSRSLDKTGVGLGLFMVKSLLKAHGENIWAESEPNEFARFTFTLGIR